MVWLFWIVTKSFWCNRKQYRFFMIALTLSTLVLSLGLSSVDVMGNMWRVPLTVMFGGHLWVGFPQTEDVSAYSVFSRAEISSLIEQVFPDALLTFSLAVPAKPMTRPFIYAGVQSVTGRAGGLDTWFLTPLMLAGEQMREDDGGQDLFYIREHSVGSVQEFKPEDAIELSLYDHEAETWSFKQALQLHPTVAGTTKWPGHSALTHLGTLQRLTQVPPELVSWIGIALPSMHAKIDAAKLAELRTILLDRFPQLEATTIDEFVAEQATADLVPLRDAAKRYIPIVLGISLMVVIASALAVVQSRRRELGMLRVIGMSAGQVRALFLLEATFAAVLACTVGLVVSKLASYLLFGINFGVTLLGILKADVSLMPFALSLIVTLAVATVVSILAVSRTMANALRNA